jgi:hypothetical protein
MYEIFFYICLLFVFKSLTIGSDFNFGLWFKHGKTYTSWYFDRQTFKEHLEKL